MNALPDFITRLILMLRELTLGELANRADCARPEDDSDGALFLAGIVDAVADRLAELDEYEELATLADVWQDDGTTHELADGAPDHRNHHRWNEFADVAAWREDIGDYGEIDADDINRSVAGVALYLIGERLIGSLASSVADDFSTMVDEASERATAIGTQHGQNAASWHLPFASADVARRVLAGIDDGDPEVLDGLPSPDLSGQFADGYTVSELLADAGLAGIGEASELATSLADDYESAFSLAVEDTLAVAARATIISEV